MDIELRGIQNKIDANSANSTQKKLLYLAQVIMDTLDSILYCTAFYYINSLYPLSSTTKFRV